MEKEEIKINAKNEDLKGSYANLMIASYTREEFCLDFLLQKFGPPLLVSRVFISPPHLKRIIKTLEDSIVKYEEKFGKLEQAPDSDFERKIGFQPE